jgi:rhodanese-related sulfurtransferase
MQNDMENDMSPKSLALLGALGLSGIPVAAMAAAHTTDSVATIKQKLEKNEAVMIDVREQTEWDAGHLKDARLVPLSYLQSPADCEKVCQELPKQKIIYCHCRSGGRVLPAADILRKKGFEIRPLKLGYEDLLKAGFPKAEP